MNDHRFIFIGGLHRSGTSLLFHCLRDHSNISGFEDTGVPEDEGQHLQTVFPAARRYGGPGRFGFYDAMHLTEQSPLATDENRARLWREWSRFWDTRRQFLVEKSPPNLIKARFLQWAFPESYFIFFLRHPVAVALATKKWKRRTSLARLLEHWAACHETMYEDLPHLNNAIVVNYEPFVAEPQAHLERLFSFIGCEPENTTQEVRTDVNEKYFRQWADRTASVIGRLTLSRQVRRLQPRIAALGYSLTDLRRPPAPVDRMTAT